MSDFKRIVKMKTGGSVSKAIGAYEKRERKSEQKSDMTQDKSMVKKGVRQHEAALHKGEPKTELKLKAGGRAKKSVGTVKKFEKASGQYGAKKGPADKKNIQQAKQFKPAFKKGGKVKKYNGEDGSWVSKGVDAVKSAGKNLYENVMGTEEQNRIAKQQIDEQAAKGSKLAKFFGGKAQAPSAPVAKCKGGKMTKKYAAGGSIDDDVRSRAMKWLEAGSPEQPTGEAVAPSAPVAQVKPVRRIKTAAAKLPMPDYSNEDLDKIDAQIAEKTRRSKRTPRQMLEEESEYTIKPDLQVKGERLMKGAGLTFKRGGRTCK